MKPLSLIAAIIAGVIGALVWAAISYYANIEVGYIAWGIGLIVGMAAHMFGAEGMTTGILCAVIAIASMLAGKALSYKFAVDQMVNEEVMPGIYEEEKLDASSYAQVTNESELRQFLINREYSDAASPSDIADDEILNFNDGVSERLKQFQADQPSLESWTTSPAGRMMKSRLMANLPGLLDGVKESLGPIDLLFGFLGISTAFKLGLAGQDDDVETA